ncbi:MAG: indole-3-glycerol phosphate synthase TrpC [Planctomycetes bacterium]|nr:indole-3-glycerol phosphate synthase TrpC [Planctomycetota bacterium]
MASILEKIVSTKKSEVDAARRKVSESELVSRLISAPPVRDFYAELAAPGPIKLIAEVKKASPSKGIIRADFDPVAIARTYESHGATCISVLTDEPYFQGSLRYLEAIRAATTIPLLRKDFIIDRYQLLEARVAGADAVLLIAECLDDCLLRGLHNQALELGMTPLVEFYEPDNLPRVLAAGATLIGVNNRDLRSFEIDLQHTIRMRERIPADRLLVGESGIHSTADVRLLNDAGVRAILVGEHLMAQADIGSAVRELMAI